MDHQDEYHTYLSLAVRTHQGSLEDAVQCEMDLAQEDIAHIGISRGWWAYAGPDTAPFVLYTRWQRDRVTIASIVGLGSQKGRLPKICTALEHTGLAVRWEAVINQSLRYALRRRGYQSQQQEPCSSADLIHAAVTL